MQKHNQVANWKSHRHKKILRRTKSKKSRRLRHRKLESSDQKALKSLSVALSKKAALVQATVSPDLLVLYQAVQETASTTSTSAVCKEGAEEASECRALLQMGLVGQSGVAGAVTLPAEIVKV